MALSIASGVLAQIIDQAERSPDAEICGLLLGHRDHIEQAVAARNLADDRAHAFELDPAMLFAALRAARAGGPEVIGHYHSHPNGMRAPSPRDAAQAQPGELWMIVADGGAALFRYHGEAGFGPVALEAR